MLWHRWLPPRAEEPARHAEVAAWQRSVGARFGVAGGSIVGSIGSTVVASFDPSDLSDAVEVALGLLHEADLAELDIVIGAALGDLTETDGSAIGSALERAQILANRGRPGELVLDLGARSLASAEFLFGRQVSVGAGSSRGATVDRRRPRREECAGAIAELGPTPLPPVVDSVRRHIEEALEAGAPRTFVLRGPVGAGASEVIAKLEQSRTPPLVLRIGAAPGGLVPLASLRLSLLRTLGSAAQIANAFPGEPGAALARVAMGELVPCDELARALAVLTASAGGQRSWVVLSPLSLVDGATLAALLEARALGADFVLFARFPIESPLPRPLLELDEEVRDLSLPPLKMSDARVVAEGILGRDTADEVTRRVAVLGGDTVLGVIEAARTLIATGELVREDGRFVWRLGPRQGANAIGTIELLSERLDLLDGESPRLLETLCVVPDGSARDLLESVAARDGIGEHAFARSVTVLSREALLVGDDRPRAASGLLRSRMMSLIPPGRVMELHRFVAEVLRERAPNAAPRRAQLGYYLHEGGLEEEASAHLSEALEALLASGYERAARQISGWLALRERAGSADAGARRATPVPPPMGFDEEPPPSSEIYLDDVLDAAADVRAPGRGPLGPSAERVAHLLRMPGRALPESGALPATDAGAVLDPTAPAGAGPESAPPAPQRSVADEAVRAIRERDFASLERAMQRAIADGSDLGAVTCVRAMAQLARGELDLARRSVRDARRRGGEDEAPARYHIAEALLDLRDGEPLMAIRAALTALAVSRRAHDERAERVSLRTLAACYRALGRDDQARRLASARD